MARAIEVTGTLPASPEQIYEGWMSSTGHAAMTGAAAEVDARVGGAFTAWDGYITGTTLELVPGQRIVQAWRSTEFPEGAPDSRLEVVLVRAGGATAVTIRHSAIPEGQEDAYESGWHEHYLEPMAAHFKARSKAARQAAPAKKQAAPGKKVAAKKQAAPGKKVAAKKQAAKKAAPKKKAGKKRR